ncbi:helix-turn-helix domain-containing protein [Pedobacter sp. HMF7647]|uniref:Helix-turn-helix domain-containing protein n=1 Tax=Hufsiella arboris TaxID=2695275 RepID=A0A7K1Y5E1_9SPHI|nr:helix-turn-helix domain-containing protein [Hufsiella arboris]MXV49640.1 helix-turn-helix domain-containing protein [Hufsiella arboris]
MYDISDPPLAKKVSHGFDMKHFNNATQAMNEAWETQRDERYLFYLLENGNASLMLDFQQVSISAPSICYIFPGQIYSRLMEEKGSGWLIAVEAYLIPREYRMVFDSQFSLNQPFCLSDNLISQCNRLLNLLKEKTAESPESPFFQGVVHSILHAFLGIAASCFNQPINGALTAKRPKELALQFKHLLLEKVKTLKSPAAYAAILNVSESYLNESLKKATGYSVSYWIQYHVLLEAKRLLYYSSLNVKEIANELGYDDHTYFSKLFKKSEGTTPLTFRMQYRK